MYCFAFAIYGIISDEETSAKSEVEMEVSTGIFSTLMVMSKNSARVTGFCGRKVPSPYPDIIHLFAKSIIVAFANESSISEKVPFVATPVCTFVARIENTVNKRRVSVRQHFLK